jgi:hypothetical protein
MGRDRAGELFFIRDRRHIELSNVELQDNLATPKKSGVSRGQEILARWTHCPRRSLGAVLQFSPSC